MNLSQAFSTLILGISSGLIYSADQRVSQVISEGQPIPDQGSGYYRNPIFSGNYGDPSIERVGDDYYMAFSRGNGVMLWHSRDLVNWAPVIRHRLPDGFDTVWAVDLQYFNGKFHVYMPIRDYPGKGNRGGFGNFVIRAGNVEGPWSEPIALEIPDSPEGPLSAIDPGFVQTPEGEKYLYVSKGWVVRLNDEGTKAVSAPVKVYDGWEYPSDWVVECFCLESPKLFYRNGFYFLVSAQGGTSGPSTAHMSVVARSRHPMGPWENSPYNPLHHTWSRNEPFWHQGHGTIFEDTDGGWWTVYHGRLKDFTEMGRPTLLMPVEWTEDGWPVQKNTYIPGSLIPIPEGKNVGHGMPLSDDFDSNRLGPQWWFSQHAASSLRAGGGLLRMTASGNKQQDATAIYSFAPNRSFEISAQVTGLSEGTTAGILVGDEGIVFDGKQVFFHDAPAWRHRHSVYPVNADAVWLKISNQEKDISFYFSLDGKLWR
ncbi:MAG: family 43 glycosylhydrolase, partial [Verrucomicrobiae bacterium]|nr:family 43 glycosylhydrolase [Verrucomicrobiae bacterium]